MNQSMNTYRTKKFNDFLNEGNVGMGSLNVAEYPLAYNTMDNPTDRGKEGNIIWHKKENMFQSIQDEMKVLIKNNLQQKNSNVTDESIDQVLQSFFSLGDNKSAEVKRISDNCKDPKQCAKDIFNKYLPYVRVNHFDRDMKNDVEGTLEKFDNFLNEGKLNGKYGFFMMLDVIDDVKNSFIKEDFLNISDFYVFFTTDKISNKDNLSDKLEYKKSLDVSYETYKHLGNLRLSFYFGVRDYVLEYGFHDDLKRTVYKVGEFKISSKFLRGITSYKCVSLIRNVLRDVVLKDLKQLNKIKSDLKYLLDGVGEVEILDNERVSCKVEKSYIKTNKLDDYFESWCFKHKWYYTTYNYVDETENEVDFMVKLKDPDSDLNKMKKNTDIKYVQKIHEDKETPPVTIPKMLEPQGTAKLTARKYRPDQPQFNRPGIGNPYLKNKGKTRAQIAQREKEDRGKVLLKYYKSLVRVIKKIDKDQLKNKGYSTQYVYKLVSEFNKPFIQVKKDLLWMKSKIIKDPYFLEKEEFRLKGIK